MARNPRNGNVPAAQLVTVEDNDQLYAPVANAFLNARDAYYAEGGRGACIVEPGGAYRSTWVQNDMHVHPKAWNLNPNSKAGLASVGYSTHGLGDSLDAMPGFNAFLLRRGREFGFSRPFGSRDPNHWRHDGRTAIIRRAGLPGAATRHNYPLEDSPMMFHDVSTIGTKAGTLFALAGTSPGTPANWLETRGPSTFANQLSAQVGASSAGVSHDTYLAWKAAYLSPLAIIGGTSVGGGSVDSTALATAIDAKLAPRLEAIRVLLAAIRGLFK